jgi:post-segregation antitoxin (ccd killing protein)
MSCILAIDAADEAVVDEAVVPVALAETISSWLDWSTAKRWATEPTRLAEDADYVEQLGRLRDQRD